MWRVEAIYIYFLLITHPLFWSFFVSSHNPTRGLGGACPLGDAEGDCEATTTTLLITFLPGSCSLSDLTRFSSYARIWSVTEPFKVPYLVLPPSLPFSPLPRSSPKSSM